VSEKESRLWINAVQAKENERQRGFEKVLDTILSNYGKAEFNLNCMWTPYHTVWQS
jgi:hypothetical protein